MMINGSLKYNNLFSFIRKLVVYSFFSRYHIQAFSLVFGIFFYNDSMHIYCIKYDYSVYYNWSCNSNVRLFGNRDMALQYNTYSMGIDLLCGDESWILFIISVQATSLSYTICIVYTVWCSEWSISISNTIKIHLKYLTNRASFLLSRLFLEIITSNCLQFGIKTL